MEEDLTTDLCVLQSHLDGMLSRVHHNSATFKRLQRFEMRLLSLSSLAEMIEFILDESRSLFDLDIISLCLVDPKGEISGLLEMDNFDHQARQDLLLLGDDQGAYDNFKLPIRPFLGGYQSSSCAGFFSHQAKKPASVGIIPLIRRSKCLGSLNFGSHQADRFIHNMATDFIEHIASVIGICLENNINFETIRRTSLVDPLTGVNNRRFLEQRIDEELDRSQRSREPLSCLFLDIDFFKRINDGFGHPAGDHVLGRVAGIIKKQLRSNDVLSRYGGEEFVALLSQSDQSCASDVAERIRLSVAALAIEFSGQAIPVTISIGVATFDPGLSIRKPVSEIAAQLIQSADSALYEAKHKGRNRVECGGVVTLK